MIPGIVLAAGKSSRMGRTKALLPVSPDETFLDRIVRTLIDGGVDDVVVVVGADSAAIRSAAIQNGTPVRVIENRDWEQGQLTSLNAGLRAVDRPGVRAALVTLIDVPLVAAATVRTLLGRYRNGSAMIVRPARGAHHGHPVVFDRVLFDEFRTASPSNGAKQVVRAHAADVLNVEIEDEGAFIDIDTPDDYERWIGPRLDPRKTLQ